MVQLSAQDKLDWAFQEILGDLEDGTVVPVLGEDLFVIERQGAQKIGLHALLAHRCAERLHLPKPRDITNLNDLFFAHLARHGKKPEDIYKCLKQVRDDLSVTPPDWLVGLARIRTIKLFVTTTFDPIVADAVKRARGIEPDIKVYSPIKDLEDLPQPLDKPVVYYLFGKLSPSPAYVASEQDTLEFLTRLQNKTHRPERLFTTLKESNLLLLGCRFPDWVTRFFLRTVKDQCLDARRTQVEYLVD
jgi:hypothetical protein